MSPKSGTHSYDVYRMEEEELEGSLQLSFRIVIFPSHPPTSTNAYALGGF
jgi:hypothetical protein